MIQMVQKKKLQWIISDLKLDAQRSQYEVNKQQEMVYFKLFIMQFLCLLIIFKIFVCR